jgi:DNA-binding NtrC family response regulator
MLAQPKVVLLSNHEEESNILEEILSEYVDLRHARNLSELQSILDDGVYDAVFCGRSSQKAAWNAALEEVRQRCPDLPVIIFSRTGGEREWVEALEAGAFDLLAPPYQRSTVLPVLEHAVVSTEGRRLHSDPLNRFATAS